MNFGRKGRFLDQRQLGVEHDAGRASGDGRGGGVQSDAAGRPDGKIDGGLREELLQQHEGGGVTDGAAGLGSLGDEPVGAAVGTCSCSGACLGSGLGQARDLDEDPATAQRGIGGRPGGPDAQHDGVNLGGEFLRG